MMFHEARFTLSQNHFQNESAFSTKCGRLSITMQDFHAFFAI